MNNQDKELILKWAGWIKYHGYFNDNLGWWYSPKGDSLPLGEKPDLDSLDILMEIAIDKGAKRIVFERHVNSEYWGCFVDGRDTCATNIVEALQQALLSMAKER